MRISTLTMLKSLMVSKNLSSYLEKYKEELQDVSVADYLNALLVQKEVTLAKVADESGLGDYVYKIFKGNRNTSRDNLIAIAVAMGLELEEAQKLMFVAQFAKLEPRRRRDSAIIFGIEKKMSVARINNLLDEIGETTL